MTVNAYLLFCMCTSWSWKKLMCHLTKISSNINNEKPMNLNKERIEKYQQEENDNKPASTTCFM